MTIQFLSSFPNLNHIKNYVFPNKSDNNKSNVSRKQISSDIEILNDEHPFLQLRQAFKTHPDGLRKGYAYAHRPNGNGVGVIIPIVHEKDGDYIIFEETERQAVKAEKGINRCIELPAGGIEEGESALEGIKRELWEETGYIADKIENQSINSPSSPGLTSETLTFAIADITNPPENNAPNDKSIKGIYKVPLKNVFSWLKEQEGSSFENGKKAVGQHVYAGLFFVMGRVIKEGKADKTSFNWNV